MENNSSFSDLYKTASDILHDDIHNFKMPWHQHSIVKSMVKQYNDRLGSRLSKKDKQLMRRDLKKAPRISKKKIR